MRPFVRQSARGAARSPRLFAFWLRDVGGDWLLRTDTAKSRLARELAEVRRKDYATTEIVEYRCPRDALAAVMAGRYRGRRWPR